MDGSIYVEVFEQAYADRCYGVVIVVEGKEFFSKNEFFPDANYNILPLPQAQEKAATIAILLGQKIVNVDSSHKELTHKTLNGVKFVIKKKSK
jgi:hypothetical protein